MEITLVITDLTRMSGSRVCIAGIAEDGRCIRPTFPQGGITEDWLYEKGEVIIKPFARVKFILVKPRSHPPHTEDWEILPDYKCRVGVLEEEEKKDILQKIIAPDVAHIFGAEIKTKPGFYVQESEGNRSLGTIRAKSINFINLRQRDSSYKYQVTFTDYADNTYKLTVTDLAFRYYIDHLRENEKINPGRSGLMLNQQFNQSEVYLRIGLARSWDEKYPGCCFLQINGIYTFPDYLEGQCFADFKPHIVEDEIQ